MWSSLRAFAWAIFASVLPSLAGAPAANAQDDLSGLRQMVGRLQVSGSWHIHRYTMDNVPVSLTEARTHPADRSRSATDYIGFVQLECSRDHAKMMFSLGN